MYVVDELYDKPIVRKINCFRIINFVVIIPASLSIFETTANEFKLCLISLH